MRFVPVLVAAILVGTAVGDTLKLRSGRVVNGNYLGGNARQIRMEVGTTSKPSTWRGGLAGIRRRYGRRTRIAPAAPVREERILRPEPTSTPAPAAAPVQTAGNVELPAGTNLVIRMIDSVNSEQNRVGQTSRRAWMNP